MAEAFATPVASNLVSKLGEYLFAPIGRQFGYVLCYKCYVEDLENGVKELENARKRVQSSVDEAMYDGKLIHTDVEDWLEVVQKKAKEAENLLKHGESAQNTCFRGWLPNPVVLHPVGRKVKKITKVIQELFMKSQSIKFQKVYHENPPIGIVAANTSTARSVDNREDVLESRAKITEDVLKAIVDDKVCVIGVWGAGGVGKSKLLEDVERRVKEENLFDVVATAIISHTPDLKEIQGAIACKLGLKLTNDEHADERARRLCKRIEDVSKKNMREDVSKKNMREDDSKKNMIEDDSKKNILIILDDLWEKLELKKVGIPCSDGNKVRGCKLLLTSRKLNVLQIDMGSDREFQLDVLEYGEARRLFERTIGDKVNCSEFEPWVDGVVKNCGGMPLSIVPLARMLKHKDLAEWKNASTNRDLSNIKSVVELSYNYIKEERIRSLFLVCALTSGRISVRDSLIYCIGLGLYKMFSETIQSARYKLIVDLHCLRDSSLLLDNDAKELFRMHDIFVEAAISIASMEHNALVGRKGYGFKVMSKDELRKCTVISFPYVGIDELPAKLDCPNLKMLMIFEHNRSLKIPESFFESMEKLQVLALIGLDITTLPPSTEFLENLQSLSLDHCRLEDVTILGKLKRLQFLSFTRSTIARLPKEIGELTELRFLDLKWCFRLQIIERGMLGSLVKLEELYINTFCQWEAEDEALRSNASLAELKNMKKLSALDITIPHLTNLSSDLPFGNLNEHKIRIGSTGYWWGEYEQSRTLKLKLDSSNLLHEVWMQECLGRTQDLRLNGSQDGSYSIHDLCPKGFQELKHLHVKNNLSFHCIADSAKCPAYTKLESLVLKNLKNLEKICHDYLAPKSFVLLKTVKVKYCDGIKYLFPSSMMKRLLQLEEIEITGCNLMQHIVANAKVEDYIDEVDNDANVKSYKLRRLTLQDLPKMTSFCKTEDHSVVFLDGQQVSLPWLETLTLSKLPKLKEIWNSQFLSNVSSLKFLKVEDCMVLLSIIPSNFLIKLQNLEAITVKRCQLIREVFDIEGLTTGGDVEILSRLTRLTLSELPSLERIWNKNPRRVLCLGNLTTLKVQNCEKLRFFFSSSMAKALRQIKEIEIASCKLMEEVVDVQEEESEEIATTNNLEFPMLASLSLVELPNLRTFSYGKYYIHCPSLTKLTISGCPKMMTFSSFEGKQQSIQQVFGRVNSGLSLPVFFNEKVLFPSLEELKLSSMCELKRIWHNQFHGQSFCKLASLTLELCENLSHVFPLNSLDRLRSLKKIEVDKCPCLEALFEPVCLSSEKRQKPLILSSLEEMKLSNLPRLRDLLKSDCKVTLTFPSLMEVNVSHCHSLPYLFSTAMAITLAKLAVLDVSCCNNLLGVIGMENGEANTVEILEFRHLSKLKLGDLEKLISFHSASQAGDGLHPLFDEKLAFPKLQELHIKGVQQNELWSEKILEKSFCCLEVLSVKQCHNLVNVIPSFMWKRLLHSMEYLTVKSCNLIEGIYTLEGLSVMERQVARSLPWRKLTLCDLPNLTYIWKNGDLLNLCLNNLTSVSLPWLETLTLSKLPKLKEIWNSQFLSNVSSLKFLKVEDCMFLLSIIPSNFLIKLQNLEAITIERCQLIREVFDLEGLTASGDVEILLRLTELTLSELPSLERLWNKNPRRALCFRNLTTLKVQNCENLRSFFSSSMAKALGQIREIEIASCKLMEEVVDVQEEESEETAITHTLEFPLLISLSLVELPNLRTFSYGKYYIHCPSLTKLMISGCPEMMTFSSFKGRQQSMRVGTSVQQAFGCINSSLSSPGFFNEKVLFPSLVELKLSSMCQLKRIWHNQLHGQSFCKLASLTIGLCENLSHVFPSNSMDRLRSLSEIEVFGCLSLEALFESVSLSSEKRQKPLELSALKKLKLLNLPRLTNILKSDCEETLTFPSLMEVNVRRCHSLSYLFSSTTAKTLHELVALDVSCCNNLRGIIVMKEGKGKTAEIFEFRHLTKLKLGDLKSLICFSSENCAGGDGLYPLFDEKLAFPKLEELHIERVQQKELWDNKILVESFCCLKGLKVKQCHNLVNVIPSFMLERLLHYMESLTVEDCACLRNLFTMSMAKSLGQLQYLDIGGCGEMEYVVAKEEEKPEEATDKIVIPQLVTLYLHNMPKLRSFCQGKHISEWPSLKEFTIEDCKAVKVILGDAGCTKLEGSGLTHQPLLLVEKIEFPDMKLMKISHMDNVERIWLDDLPSNAFSKLKTLVVEYCEKLSSIFSSYTMLTRFQNLEKINVTDCGSLEVVFHVQEFNFTEAPSISTFQLKELILKQLPKMKHVWSGLPQVSLTFECVECIKVNKCESLKILFPSSVAKSMTQLKELFVWDCGVEEIVAEEDGIGTSEGSLFFPRLTDLRLVDLPEFKSFYRNGHTSTWPFLKKLKVRRCGKMRSFSFACEYQSYQGTTTSENQAALFSFEKVIPHLEGLALAREDVAMIPQHYVFHNLKELDLACYHDENVAFLLLRKFPNLEELSVKCSSFEEIFPEDSSGHGGATPCGDLTDMAKPLQELRNLNRLDLYELHNLKRVWKDGSLMTEILKLIEVLWVEECPRLPIVLPSPISFQRLAYLGVEDCSGLVHMGTCSAATSLVHLTWLSLRNCGAMEDVITDDENGAGDISFPKLEKLILDDLPSLESFSNTNRAFRFPSLVRIVVTKCPKMNIFCKGALRTPKLDEVLLSKEDDEGHWEGDLNTTIQTLSALNDPQRIQ